MTNNKDFSKDVLAQLQKLCENCDKAPTLQEPKLQALPEPELLTKWWSKNDK